MALVVAMTPHLTQNLGPIATSMIGAACLVPRLATQPRLINPDEPCLSVGPAAGVKNPMTHPVRAGRPARPGM